MPQAVGVKRDLGALNRLYWDGLGGFWRELLAVLTALDSRVEPWNDDDYWPGWVGQGCVGGVCWVRTTAPRAYFADHNRTS